MGYAIEVGDLPNVLQGLAASDPLLFPPPAHRPRDLCPGKVQVLARQLAPPTLPDLSLLSIGLCADYTIVRLAVNATLQQAEQSSSTTRMVH
mgnify:CR=1 FL=1